MKLQRRFAPTGGEFAPESVARFTGIRTPVYFYYNCLFTVNAPEQFR